MRVLHVITTTSHGGAETHLLGLSEELQRRGWSVAVLCLLEPGSLAQSFENKGIAVHSLGLRRGELSARILPEFRRVVRQFGPDVIHSHMMPATLLTRAGRALFRLPPLVSTAHATQERGLIRNLVFALSDPLSAHVTNVSSRGLDRYRKCWLVSRSRSSYIPNGVASSFLKSEPPVGELTSGTLQGGILPFRWLAVGRLHKDKDYENLLSALSLLKKQSTNFRLVIAGDGAERPRIEEIISQEGLEQFVELLGLVENVKTLYSSADALVLPSRNEGLPMVLLEAAASSLPIVATNVGGVSDVVLDGQTGYLVPPRDAYSLADAMLKMMKRSPVDLERMGANARCHVKKSFSMEETASRWESLYRGVINAKRS